MERQPYLQALFLDAVKDLINRRLNGEEVENYNAGHILCRLVINNVIQPLHVRHSKINDLVPEEWELFMENAELMSKDRDHSWAIRSKLAEIYIIIKFKLAGAKINKGCVVS